MSRNSSLHTWNEPLVFVRSAAKCDAQTVADILRATYSPFISHFEPSALRWSVESVREEAAAWLIAITKSGCIPKAVGAVRHGDDPLGYTFDALAVRPELQRRGVGSQLVRECESIASNSGRQHVTIVLRTSLTSNVAFFTRRQYRPWKEYGANHFLFRKEL